jgi:NAD(P)-dependent dehydrogenase (short-subunit alcohol dehydrogenase family)
MSLEGKVAIVTASTRGIGYAVVKKLAEKGATVYMAARRMEFAQSLADELNKNGLKVKTVFFDAYDHACYQAMADTVVKAEGRIDILVNNFGTSNPKTDLDIANTTFEDFKNTIDVNLESVFSSVKAVLPTMQQQKSGAIINISSIGGIVPDISQIGYGTSKAAINYLTKLIAVQEARNNITCNAVLPGMTATDAVTGNLTPAFQEFFLKHTPIRRMATPEEIADAVAYFASEGAAFTTGQILDVSGGFGLPTPVYGDMIAMKNRR